MRSLAKVQLVLAKHQKQAQGLVFIVTAAVIWVLASFVVQEVEDEGLSPFLLSYNANSLFVVYLPLDKLLKGARGASQWSRLDEDSQRSSLNDNSLEEANETTTLSEPNIVGVEKVLGYFEKNLFNAAAVVAPLWFLAQLTFNISLHLTSVTSNTILSSTASLFTYGLSWAVLQEPFVAHKLASILVCAIGTSIVTLADSSNQQRPSSVAGDALCLLSAGFYACYTVAIKRMLGGDEETNMVLFFGYVGLINLVCLAPVLLLLQLVSIVNMAQMTFGMLGLVIAKGLLDNVLSDYLWARAVLLVGPTVATVGMSVQVPLAVGLDIVYKRPQYIHDAGTVTLMVLGGWYVLAGFVGINMVPRKREPELSKPQSSSPSTVSL